MAALLHHLFLEDSANLRAFTSPTRGSRRKLPDRDRDSHGKLLERQFQRVWNESAAAGTKRFAVSLPVKSGAYVQFFGAPGFDLPITSLENRQAGIRLRNVRTEEDSQTKLSVTRATVFVPQNKEGYFLKRVRSYLEESTQKGKPKHQRLVESIEQIRLALLESAFWQDDNNLIPGETPIWCEVWLSSDELEAETRFRELAEVLGFQCEVSALQFPERTVLLALLTRDDLVNLIESSDDIAEFRLAKETAHFFVELPNVEQAQWVTSLLQRVSVRESPQASICILDTGVNNEHPLLKPVIGDEDCQTYDTAWGMHDHQGHGTLMSGLAAYGDLQSRLESNDNVELLHALESVKILPPHGENEKRLWGYITSQAVSQAEIQDPDRRRVVCMAVTATDDRDRGRPSSWSAAVDSLSSGYNDDERRLVFVSAGNIEDQKEWRDYPYSNLTNSIHDPGQAWNALTIGAYTRKVRITDPDLAGYEPVAPADGLSPYSTTSLSWEATRWPVKPDIVLEGGNVLRAPNGSFTSHDDVSVLSTHHEPTHRHFALAWATSAATAQASWLAAQIQAAYPHAWPETVRGLLVHSAQWTGEMKRQFLAQPLKSEYAKLLRVCGYGVPDPARAIECANNYLTLIAQEEIQPFEDTDGRRRTKEMHLYELPWPRDELLELGDLDATLRITLSYFVEPGPGEVGWRDRYRYPSHALRFDLNTVGESQEDFEKRINAASRHEDEDQVGTSSGSERWTIGANGRNLGSIHSDIWEGSAAEIATCNLVGVYPVIGWWRERYYLGRCGRRTRYSLIVSLSTPEQTVDLYSPVAVKIGIPIPV